MSDTACGLHGQAGRHSHPLHSHSCPPSSLPLLLCVCASPPCRTAEAFFRVARSCSVAAANGGRVHVEGYCGLTLLAQHIFCEMSWRHHMFTAEVLGRQQRREHTLARGHSLLRDAGVDCQQRSTAEADAGAGSMPLPEDTAAALEHLFGEAVQPGFTATQRDAYWAAARAATSVTCTSGAAAMLQELGPRPLTFSAVFQLLEGAHTQGRFFCCEVSEPSAATSSAEASEASGSDSDGSADPAEDTGVGRHGELTAAQRDAVAAAAATARRSLVAVPSKGPLSAPPAVDFSRAAKSAATRLWEAGSLPPLRTVQYASSRQRSSEDFAIMGALAPVGALNAPSLVWRQELEDLADEPGVRDRLLFSEDSLHWLGWRPRADPLPREEVAHRGARQAIGLAVVLDQLAAAAGAGQPQPPVQDLVGRVRKQGRSRSGRGRGGRGGGQVARERQRK